MKHKSILKSGTSGIAVAAVAAGLALAANGADYNWQKATGDGNGSFGTLENWTLIDESPAMALPGSEDRWVGLPPYTKPGNPNDAVRQTYTINIPAKETIKNFEFGNGSDNQRRTVTFDFGGTGGLEVLGSSSIGGKYLDGEYFSRYTFKNGTLEMSKTDGSKWLKIGEWRPVVLEFSGMTFEGGFQSYSRSAGTPNMIVIKDGSQFTAYEHAGFKFGDGSCFATIIQIEGEGTKLMRRGNSSVLQVEGAGSRLIVKDGAELDLPHGLRTINPDTGILMTNIVYRQQADTWIGYGVGIFNGKDGKEYSMDWNGPSNNFLHVRNSLFDCNGKNFHIYGEEGKIIFDNGSVLTNTSSGMMEMGCKGSNAEFVFDGAKLLGYDTGINNAIRMCLSCPSGGGAETLCHNGTVSNGTLRIGSGPSTKVRLHSIVMQGPSRIAFDVPAEGWEEMPLTVADEIRYYVFENRGKSRVVVNVSEFRKKSKSKTVDLMTYHHGSGTASAVQDMMENEVYVDVRGDGNLVNAKDLNERSEGKITFNAATRTLSYTAPPPLGLVVVIK